MMQNLGRLEQVDLRDTWANEAGDFTPWLAGDDNLKLLGDTVGLDLELEAQEKDVGPFRADILCKDTATGDWVLIENQLERTDHCHLGQILTYAAGLHATTIIWIAQRFTEEHRAAIDWLNEITGEKFSFFGLEIELWRIGDSPVAPKFNIVCKPNDWTKPGPGPRPEWVLTPTEQLQMEYWAALWQHLTETGTSIKGAKPQPQNWLNFATGRSNFTLVTLVNTQKKFIAVGMSCLDDASKECYRQLEQDKTAIEAEVGEPLLWEELPNRKESRVRFRLDIDPADRTSWPQQHAWMKSKLELLHRVFAKRVKNLQVGAYAGATAE